MRVAILRAMMEGQSGDPSLRVWKASSSGQYWNWADAVDSDARDIAPRAPWSLRRMVQERMAAEQKSSHTVGRLRPHSDWGACSPARGKAFGRRQILRQADSSVEYIVEMSLGERAMRQWVCIILEEVP